MQAEILAIATSLPANSLSTGLLLAECKDKLSSRLVKTIENMGVENRYSVLKNAPEAFLGKEEIQASTTATELGALAAKECLEKANAYPDEVGLLIAATNTQSRLLPRLASDVMALLRGFILPTISLVNMQGQGCAVLLKAVEVVQWYLCANPNQKALIVLSEAATPYVIKHLASKEYYSFREIKAMRGSPGERSAKIRDTQEAIQAFLFGDGAVALLLGSRSHDSNTSFGPISHLTNEQSNDANLLVMSDGGSASPVVDGVPRYWMGPDVPQRGAVYAAATVKELLENERSPINHLWETTACLIHTGSRKILDSICDRLGLSPTSSQVASSYNILRKYGNLSSASVGFMLAERSFSSGTGIIIIFGIGFSASAGILTFPLTSSQP